MEDLKQLLSCLNAESDVKTITETFEDIANILLFKSYIKTDYGNYRILEIEFYFWNNNHKDNLTIKRTEDEDEGMWWLHEWGVDLSFKSSFSNSSKCKQFYGGVLIRSMIKINDNQSDKHEAIYGPRNCCEYLFYSSALKSNNAPQIVVNDEREQHIGQLDSDKRYFSGDPKDTDGEYRDSKYRFYVNGIKLAIPSSYKKASPWK